MSFQNEFYENNFRGYTIIQMSKLKPKSHVKTTI